MNRLVSLLLAMALMAAGAVEALAADSARTTVRRHRPVVVFTHSASIIRLAERGNARAQARLGFLYEYGRGLPQDFALAAMWYRRSAEQGNADGQHLLGLLYNKGRGVPENLVEAYKWLNLAAAGARGRNRNHYILMRDAVSSKMDRYEIAEAQRRSREFSPVREHG
jgi:uncharacterized protein